MREYERIKSNAFTYVCLRVENAYNSEESLRILDLMNNELYSPVFDYQTPSGC